MGPVGGMKYIIAYEPRRINLRDFNYNDRKVKYILIDANSVVNRYAIGSFNTKKYIVDRKGNKIPEIYYLFAINMRFTKPGLKPVFVFDGCNPELKAET